MTSSPKTKNQRSTVTVEWTKRAKAKDLHYPCVSIATVNLLTRIQAEPVPVAKKIKGEHNAKSPSPNGCSIGPLITNKFVELRDGLYCVTWKGTVYINQLREEGLLNNPDHPTN